DYPYFRDRSLRIPDEVYDASDELRLLARVEDCWWTGTRFTVLGDVAIHRVERRPRKVRLFLSDGNREVPVPARRTKGGKYLAEIDPAQLRDGGPAWRLHAVVDARGLELTGHFRDGDAHRAWRLPVPRRSRTGMDFAQ
ncbi:MAG: glycosyltransferase, partial [Nonomuraea muscovyensis]|nr:glycosyltransferase [Nonomuraea muscovyensis]